MNTFDSLSLLKNRLATAVPSQVELRRSDAIDKVLAQLQAAAKAGGQIHVPRDLQMEAVQRFWHTKCLTSLRDARLVSFGLGLHAWEDGRCLLEEEELFEIVLNAIKQQCDTPRKLRRCYQGLVRSYFEYDGMAQSCDAPGRKNWLSLRTCLQKKIGFLQDDQSITPDWLDCALENPNLFTDNPAQTYGQELLQNNSERVDTVRQLMGITDTSWFTRALVIGQIKTATEQSNSYFKNLVTRLLQLIEGNEFLRNYGLRLILEHYANIPNAPQHVGLKKCAAQWWGNPLLSSNDSQWGAVCLKKSRDMVSNWLKKEFIHLFFIKLAEDGLSDTRRVKFWEKYADSVDEMYFALGNYARQSLEQDFIEIRKELDGLIVQLDGSGKTNNAFIMQIGDLIMVEFSGVNHALYGYSKKQPLPFSFKEAVYSGPVGGVNSLKNDEFKNLYLTHQDNVSPYFNWEDRFANKLRIDFNISPNEKSEIEIIGTDYRLCDNKKLFHKEDKRSNKSNFSGKKTYDLFYLEKTSTPIKHDFFSIINLKILAQQINGAINDNTDKGGALWIYAKKFNSESSKTLKQWGFTYSDGKGWWKK